MSESNVIKELGALEKQATKQEEVIEAVKANLSDEKKKYDSIISDIRSLIRDENNGQEKIKFTPHNEPGAQQTPPSADKHKGKRLIGKKLRLPEKHEK
jgi:uncharacterized coiled-coil protein SlyX